jgi:kumamolisin
VSRQALREARHGRLVHKFAAIAKFAAAHGLAVTLEDPARRLIKLAGPAEKMQIAFGAKLHHFEHEGRDFVGRSGSLSAPSDIVDQIESVLGLDTRPAATSKIAFPRVPAQASGYLPNAVAALYGFPSGTGKGECIALIELGGGYNDSDVTAAFGAMKLAPPIVVAVPVSGGSNAPGDPNGADGEVALDIQVAGGAAPGAKIAVYFAPNTDQGFVDAITAAVHDEENAPSIVSISWGSAESVWTQQSVTSMSSAFADAVSLGVSVFVASGDNLAADGVSDGQAHVDFPASCPTVVGCGGTKLTAQSGKIADETVWNSDGGGSGGGVSTLFPLPDYQDKAGVPVSVSTGKPGRGVPDVAGDADPNTGYRVVVDGQSQIVGGTSAVAPLWAGLFALLNAARGTSIGQPHAILYAGPQALRDVTQGNNETSGVGYEAGPGWDACTGLGTPDGAALLQAFASPATS